MPLTRRGWAVAALAVALFFLAGANGPRSINAVVAPALVALVAALSQVRLRDRPPIERRAPDAGVVDDELTVELDVETERSFGATIDDRLGEGLTAAGLPATTTVGGEPFSYDVRLWRRGERQIGPLELTVPGLFGLARKTFYYNDLDTVLVYPRAFRLDPPPGALTPPPSEQPFAGTDEFDGLREYRRGDTRRDVHWKSSAKRPDDELLVREYVAEGRRGELTVGVSPGEREDTEARDASSPGSQARQDDDVAEAAASVALYLLDAGFEVGLVTPDETLEPAAGRAHRESALAALARLGPGALSDDRERRADLVVRSAGGDVLVSDGDETTPFDRLVATAAGERVRYDRPTAAAGVARGGPDEPEVRA